jgi:hypothetical protein
VPRPGEGLAKAICLSFRPKFFNIYIFVYDIYLRFDIVHIVFTVCVGCGSVCLHK